MAATAAGEGETEGLEGVGWGDLEGRCDDWPETASRTPGLVSVTPWVEIQYTVQGKSTVGILRADVCY